MERSEGQERMRGPLSLGEKREQQGVGGTGWRGEAEGAAPWRCEIVLEKREESGSEVLRITGPSPCP